MNFLLKLLLLGAVSIVDSASAKYVPARISFTDLASGNELDGDDVFWKTLREVGLLSVTDVPDFNKNSMLKDLEDCLHRQKDVGAPDFNLDHLRGDRQSDDHGRFRRRTLATRTLSGTPEGILVATKPKRDAEEKMDTFNANLCGDLQVSSQTFRNAVQSVSEAVAARFGSMESLALDGDSNRKLSVETLINKGEHLEHFHSYYSENNEASTMDAETTIDWHTDQGMMLLFTPAQFQDETISNGFFIRLGDGSTAEVAFDSNIDDLVIMLGDGVNQYINGDDAATPSLRAVPHAVTLPNKSNDENPRLWYGRMVLPPPKAIHPSGKGSTFEDVRTAMIEGDRDALALGCATSNVSARELMEDKHFEGDEDDMSCDKETSIMCWMTCMSYEEQNVSVESCASESEDHSLVCANEDGELWDTGHNPAFSLRCLSALEIKSSNGGMDMDHDHSKMDHSSAAGLFVIFGVIPGILGMMMVAMI